MNPTSNGKAPWSPNGAHVAARYCLRSVPESQVTFCGPHSVGPKVTNGLTPRVLLPYAVAPKEKGFRKGLHGLASQTVKGLSSADILDNAVDIRTSVSPCNFGEQALTTRKVICDVC